MRVSICLFLLLQQICDIWLTYRGLFPTRYQHSCHGHGSYVYDTYSSHALFWHCVIQITIFSTYHHFIYGDEDSYFLIGKILARWSHRMEIFFALLVLCGGESTGHQWIPLAKASDAELWYFLWSAPEPTVEQTMEKPVIWDAIALIMTSLEWEHCFINT